MTSTGGTLLTYVWTCPICGETKRGLTAERRETFEAQARNALVGHVRMTTGHGHGEAGELPPGFDEDAVGELVDVSEEDTGER